MDQSFISALSLILDFPFCPLYSIDWNRLRDRKPKILRQWHKRAKKQPYFALHIMIGNWIWLSTVILPIQSFIFANLKFQLIEKNWNSYIINTEVCNTYILCTRLHVFSNIYEKVRLYVWRARKFLKKSGPRNSLLNRRVNINFTNNWHKESICFTWSDVLVLIFFRWAGSWKNLDGRGCTTFGRLTTQSGLETGVTHGLEIPSCSSVWIFPRRIPKWDVRIRVNKCWEVLNEFFFLF